MKAIAIFGAAGKMGGGILRALLTHTDYSIQAYDVGLKDAVRLETVQNALWNDLHNFKKSKHELWYPSLEKVTGACEKVKWLETNSTTMCAFLPHCDIIIEAVYEDFNIKKELYECIEKFFPKNNYIFTNTSTITINNLAKCLQFNERFMGLHFFNPVPAMPLIEAIMHSNTAGRTVRIAELLADNLDKKLIYAPDTPGFVVNGCYVPAIKVALEELDSGKYTPETIDNACTTGKWLSFPPAKKYVETLIAEAESILGKYKSDKRLGHYTTNQATESIEELMKLGTKMPIGPLELGRLLKNGRAQEIANDPKSEEKYKLRLEMGPFKFIDLVGADVALDCVKSINAQDPERKWIEPKTLLDMKASGNLGLKTGKGFYHYSGVDLTFPESWYTKIVFGDGKRNSLSNRTVKDLRNAFAVLKNSPKFTSGQIKYVFLQSRGKHFATGADITEFPLCLKDEGVRKAAILEGVMLMWDIAHCAVPVIALLEGMTLGGGYELALACDAIIAKEGSIVGLPEKRLGILPGWGGTQRLPRRVGIENAIWMILGGEQRKVEVPWVDDVLEKDEFSNISFLNMIAQSFQKRKFEPLNYGVAQNLWYVRKLMETSFGLKYQKDPPSALLALRAMWHGNKKDLSLGLEEEFDAVLEAFQTKEAENGIRHFLATGEHLYRPKQEKTPE